MDGTDIEMSEQEVTYSTLRFLQSPSESQDRVRPGSAQRPEKTGNKGFSVPWHPIAVSLGILCLLLLMTITVLVLKVFQHIQEKHQLEESLQSLSIKYDILKNDCYVKEQLLTNTTLEYDILKNESLQQPTKELNSDFYKDSPEKKMCHRKKNLQKSLQDRGILSSESWSCCGDKCYYFSPEHKDWNGCREICEKHNSSLLMIADSDELRFIQTQTDKNWYWIGLSYRPMESKWRWIDNTAFSGINSAVRTLLPKEGKCAFISATRLEPTECTAPHNCVCERIVLRLLQ